MILVVGLGNPGKKYDRTKHNVGFEVIDLLASRYRYPVYKSWKKSATAKGLIAGVEVFLSKPQTFMNLSGESVGPQLRFYKEEPSSLIVIHDELDFDPGKVKIKTGGGHGGHNGLRSIMEHVGRDFQRVRIGIGKPPNVGHGADHVLGPFNKETRLLVDEAIEDAAHAAELIIEHGVKEAMSRFNGSSNTNN